ncbi:hypothetical protein FA15DRAFT_600945, partial [Coprinopsis marcescibilis]
RLRFALKNSVSQSTAKNYSSALSAFTRFCNKESIPVRLQFPSSEYILCAFAASGAGTLSASTVRNRLAALRNYHITHGLPWNGSQMLQSVIAGVDRLLPPSSRRPLRLPVDAKMITKLVSSLNLHEPFDAAVAACASVAFWGQARLRELLQTSARSLQNPVIPLCRHLRKSHRNKKSWILQLPQTKTKRHGDDMVLVRQDTLSDPHFLLRNHFHVSAGRNSHNLFVYASKFGPRNLTKAHFLERCNQIWTGLGYTRFTGHSFRIGGTTELLLAGVPPDVVKAMGRWSSDSFLRYWRTLDGFAPSYTENLHTSKRTKKRVVGG